MALDRNILEAQIAALFADNNAGEITPQRLRDVFTNVLDSVVLKNEVVAGGSGLRWLVLQTGGVNELSVTMLPIGSSMVFSNIDGGASFQIIDAISINGLNNIDTPITITQRMGEAVLINRITEFEILAHLLVTPDYR